MSQDLYYTAPHDELFNDLKSASIALWKTYDNTYGYADEKINQIKDLENIKDNFMYMFAMFDVHNQWRILNAVLEETAEALLLRLPAGYLSSLSHS